MSREERELLLKDLCSRLPYYVKLWSPIADGNWAILTPVVISNLMNADLSLEQVKPYLRPIYSMTEDEARFILKFILGDQKVYMVNVTKDGIEAYVDDGVASFDKNYVFHNEIVRSLGIFDYLNERQFDYRGLIEKGLALEAPEGIYK